MTSSNRLRVGVIGHVEHITLGRVPTVPNAGDIAHLEAPFWFPGGGGGITFYQLLNSDSEVHLFSAVGDDEAGAQVEGRLRETGAVLHLARRSVPHTRDIVMIDPQGERTIVVVGEPLHPRADDSLPWDVIGQLDAVYFTAQDPAVLAHARSARRLIVTARRQAAIRASQVNIDVIVGSHADPRESSARSDYTPAPTAIVMTEGGRGGIVETVDGVERFAAAPVDSVEGGAYGAGDSFAGALVHFVAQGRPAHEAATRAARFGAAVLGGLNPLDVQRKLPSLRESSGHQ